MENMKPSTMDLDCSIQPGGEFVGEASKAVFAGAKDIGINGVFAQLG